MADANQPPRSSKVPHDDETDHIGSGASTPPGGAATPRPDFADKRLPGIVNTYFAQVCDSLRLPKSSNNSPASPSKLSVDASAEDVGRKGPGPHTAHPNGLPTAPSSPVPSSFSSVEGPPLLPHEQPHDQPEHPPSDMQAIYPTPPLSSSSSMHKPERDGEVKVAERAPRLQYQRKTSIPALPSKLRRNTLASTVLQNIVTAPQVSAHISNPAAPSEPQSAPSSPSVARRSSSRRSSEKEKRVLTQGVRLSQNTPPQTPRALSQDNKSDDGATSGTMQVPTEDKSSRSSSGTSDRPPVGRTRGQLQVEVLEGRGLRPSTAPYVVCIYQLNEDISEGANDEMDTRQDSGPEKEEDLAKGVAMRRLGSDQGRPMAIPGRPSRQTSQTDIAKLRQSAANRQTTDPVWKHNAVL